MSVNIRQIQIILSLKKEELNIDAEELKRQVLEKLVDINVSKFDIVINNIDTKHSSAPCFTITLNPIQTANKK